MHEEGPSISSHVRWIGDQNERALSDPNCDPANAQKTGDTQAAASIIGRNFQTLALLAVPIWTCLFALVPEDVATPTQFYGSSHAPEVLSFWILIGLTTVISYWFLFRLQHVWVLEFFAEQLRSAGIIVAFDGSDGALRWKRTSWDKLSLAVVLGVSIYLLILELTAPAVAVLLQLGYTQRNNFEVLLARPAVKLPFRSGVLTVVPESALREAVLEFVGTDSVLSKGQFTRTKLIERVLAKTAEMPPQVSEGEEQDQPEPISRWCSTRHTEHLAVWSQSLMLDINHIQKAQNNQKCVKCCGPSWCGPCILSSSSSSSSCCQAAGCSTQQEAGELHHALIKKVFVPWIACIQLLPAIQNGQLILAVAFGIQSMMTMTATWTADKATT
jgi:hypothetical protein